MVKHLNPKGTLPQPGPLADAKAVPAYKGSPMQKKAYNAYHNARQRCTNPKNMDYPRYGGAGIKFLFTSLEQFMGTAGLPTNSSQSLDRINPEGHYELGNVRWATASVQALNKAANPHKSVPTLADYQAKYAASDGQATRRKDLVDAWDVFLTALHRGFLAESDLASLKRANLPNTIFDAGFELGQVRDTAEPPSYFHLPSLTSPGKVVRVRGGPFRESEYDPQNGRLAGMAVQPLDTFVPQVVREWVKKAANGGLSGSAWFGQPSDKLLNAGGVEGWMLAIASRIPRQWQRSAVFSPALKALAALEALGNPSHWDEIKAPVLDATYLLIPDFQLDAGDGFNLSNQQWSRLGSLLRYRRAHGLKTLIGAQNPHKLPEQIREEIFRHLEVEELKGAVLSWTPVPTSAISTGPASQHVPPRYNLVGARASMGHKD